MARDALLDAWGPIQLGGIVTGPASGWLASRGHPGSGASPAEPSLALDAGGPAQHANVQRRSRWREGSPCQLLTL
jgi:hypothetical protein